MSVDWRKMIGGDPDHSGTGVPERPHWQLKDWKYDQDCECRRCLTEGKLLEREKKSTTPSASVPISVKMNYADKKFMEQLMAAMQAPISNVTWVSSTSGRIPSSMIYASTGNPNPGWEALEEEMTINPIIGVRQFAVDSLYRLRPIAKTEAMIWKPGENVAMCHRYLTVEGYARHEGVHGDCSCGFYAYTTRGGFNSNRGGLLQNDGYAVVTGAIEAYGKIFVASKGIRAEKARIIALVNAADRLYEYYPGAQRFTSEAHMFQELIKEPVPDRRPDTDPDFWEKP